MRSREKVVLGAILLAAIACGRQPTPQTAANVASQTVELRAIMPPASAFAASNVLAAPLVALAPELIELPANTAPGVDVGIGDDRIYGRPVSWSLGRPFQREGMLATISESRAGVFIAWRNTNLIEEVEVRVRNLGRDAARASVFVDVLDEEGNTLIHLEPPEEKKIVELPPRDRGGEEGKIVKMQADRSLNRLIDQYDRIRRRYDVRATIRSLDANDLRLRDNAKIKAYNIPFRATPGQRHFLSYVFANLGTSDRQVEWKLESTRIPAGWQPGGTPLTPGTFTLRAGERIKGFLSMDVGTNAAEGDLVETRLSLVDPQTGEVVQQHEWFLVYDTQLPEVSNVQVAPDDSGYINMSELVADRGSGVLEATGVWVEYSTDNGRTFGQRAHNYITGNFVDPTTFTTRLGPFRPGTTVLLYLNASDTAGNIRRIGPQSVNIR